MNHECQCDRHDCRYEVVCPDGVDCHSRDCPLDLCDVCMNDPRCNGADFHPSRAEDEHSFLGEKL